LTAISNKILSDYY